MRTRAIRMARRIALFVLGWMLLNYPILAIFNTPGFVRGLPLLYVYLFVVWMLLVVLIAGAARKRRISAPSSSTSIRR